jgi:hypothetical protein
MVVIYNLFNGYYWRDWVLGKQALDHGSNLMALLLSSTVVGVRYNLCVVFLKLLDGLFYFLRNNSQSKKHSTPQKQTLKRVDKRRYIYLLQIQWLNFSKSGLSRKKRERINVILSPYQLRNRFHIFEEIRKWWGINFEQKVGQNGESKRGVPKSRLFKKTKEPHCPLFPTATPNKSCIIPILPLALKLENKHK